METCVPINPAIFVTLQVNVNYTFKDNLLKVSRSLSIDNSSNVASSDWKRVLHGKKYVWEDQTIPSYATDYMRPAAMYVPEKGNLG